MNRLRGKTKSPGTGKKNVAAGPRVNIHLFCFCFSFFPLALWFLDRRWS
jgi:hypothetical protein